VTPDRIAALRAMLATNPRNVLARFGLANELAKAGEWAAAATEYEQYLAGYDDEGNGWARLAEAYTALGRADDARAAFIRGIAASERFGHFGMAEDLSEKLRS
jgi:predicted Zn-dependent protease